MTATPAGGPLDGAGLRAAFAAAAAHLRDCAPAVDAINVYPVPDGDTGSNMAATLREAVEAAALVEPAEVSGVLGALARGALYGARGNSGVILSQALRGLAEGAGACNRFDAAALAAGLDAAACSAYAAVVLPKEGTMLTVLRAGAAAAGAEAAALPAGGQGLPCLGVLQRATLAAEEAEAVTIDQLPELSEAGVTDAGGEGVCVILRGLTAALTGVAPTVPVAPERPIAAMPGHASDGYGFCTEFLIEADPARLDVAAVRVLMSAGNRTSVVVVGDSTAVRVHAHTRAPEALIEAAGRFGRVVRVKIDDMTAQHERFRDGGSGATARLAVLALSPGAGFDAVFRSLGVAVARMGEVEKPSAGAIAAEADALQRADVIILPNHENVVLAAEQAATLARSSLHVVPARTLAQGVAAALSFSPEETAAGNAAVMREAIRGVRTVEVTLAAADRTAGGLRVARGQAIALLDGRLVAGAKAVLPALVDGLRAAGAGADSLVTVYTGEGVSAAVCEAARDLLAATFGATVEIHPGGQHLYPFIVSVE